MRFTREDIERREHAVLSPLAAYADCSQGRERDEELDPYRTCYQRDRDRILHCKSFRRLSHKTQVFIAAEGDHYRTRLTHTLEVSQISRTVARSLGLSEDLTEAIALGHDLGHTPFGHTGESALQASLARRLGIAPGTPEAEALFRHNEQSRRVVEYIEDEGRGLNLTLEVRDGIECHTGDRKAMTLEGRIVSICDRIAYVNHDIDDAVRGGIIKEAQLPATTHKLLGDTRSERIATLVRDLVAYSEERDDIVMSPHMWDAMMELREFLFHNVYTASDAKGEDPKAFDLVCALFDHYVDHPEQIPDEYLRIAKGDALRAATDYVACMTDRYALDAFAGLFIPRRWPR